MQHSAIIIILGSLTNYAVCAEIHRLNCTLNFKSWYMHVNKMPSGLVVRTSVFGWWTFPDFRLISS